jgi:hypothetical protein
MSASRYYILEAGEPVPVADMMTWALWFEEASRSMTRHLGDDTIGAARVSTVFLGLNHAWNESEPPLIFETMVFGGPLDGEQERWSTTDQAINGHAAMCERVRKMAHLAPRED